MKRKYIIRQLSKDFYQKKEKERRMDPVPRNFIIAVYDVDNNRLYYYEYDS